MDETLALGGVSAIFWTLIFQTTIKYVFITLRADNHGEGGIFSLYALIKRYSKYLVIPAILGGSFLLADSIITPPISVTSAIEGLKILKPDIPVVPIVLIIILLLFLVQRAGTSLDVYKRQPVRIPDKRRLRRRQFPQPRIIARIIDRFRRIKGRPALPVSYTHLDVYKRQALYAGLPFPLSNRSTSSRTARSFVCIASSCGASR